jgi:hypothetical protein
MSFSLAQWKEKAESAVGWNSYLFSISLIILSYPSVHSLTHDTCLSFSHFSMLSESVSASCIADQKTKKGKGRTPFFSHEVEFPSEWILFFSMNRLNDAQGDQGFWSFS